MKKTNTTKTTPDITLREFRYDSPHFSSKAENNTFRRRCFPEEPFTEGQVLFEIVHFGLFRTHRNAISAPEDGVLVSASPDGTIVSGGVIGTWFSRKEWDAFSALLSGHKESISRFRKTGSFLGGGSNSGLFSANPVRALRKDVTGLRETAEGLVRKLGEFEAIEKDLDAQIKSAAGHGNVIRKESARLLNDRDGFLETIPIPDAVLALYARREEFFSGRLPVTEAADLMRLRTRAQTLLEKDYPFRASELVPVAPHVERAVGFLQEFTAGDEAMAHILSREPGPSAGTSRKDFPESSDGFSSEQIRALLPVRQRRRSFVATAFADDSL